MDARWNVLLTLLQVSRGSLEERIRRVERLNFALWGGAALVTWYLADLESPCLSILLLFIGALLVAWLFHFFWVYRIWRANTYDKARSVAYRNALQDAVYFRDLQPENDDEIWPPEGHSCRSRCMRVRRFLHDCGYKAIWLFTLFWFVILGLFLWFESYL